MRSGRCSRDRSWRSASTPIENADGKPASPCSATATAGIASSMRLAIARRSAPGRGPSSMPQQRAEAQKSRPVARLGRRTPHRRKRAARQERIIKAKLQADVGDDGMPGEPGTVPARAGMTSSDRDDELGVANLKLVSHFERARGDWQPVDEDRRGRRRALRERMTDGEEKKRDGGSRSGEAERVSPSTRVKTSPSCRSALGQEFHRAAANSIAHGYRRRLVCGCSTLSLRTIRSDSAVVDRIGIRRLAIESRGLAASSRSLYLKLHQAVHAY